MIDQIKLAAEVKKHPVLVHYYWWRNLYKSFIHPYRFAFVILFVYGFIVVNFKVSTTLYNIGYYMWCVMAAVAIPLAAVLADINIRAGVLFRAFAIEYATDQQSIKDAIDKILNPAP